MALAIGTTLSSCERETGTESPDNIQEFPKMTLKNSGNQNDRLYLKITDDAVYYRASIGKYSAYTVLSFSGTNLFSVIDEYWADGHFVSRSNSTTPQCCESKILSVGDVSGLSEVNNVPSSGWSDHATVQVGHGYIIRSQSTSFSLITFRRYAKVYVESWVKGATGDIIGVVVQYENNWMVDY